jgi:hypothetical protein
VPTLFEGANQWKIRVIKIGLIAAMGLKTHFCERPNMAVDMGGGRGVFINAESIAVASCLERFQNPAQIAVDEL